MKSNVIPFEYQGQPVRFRADGWINATEAAARFNKEPSDWLTQRENVEYLCALAEAVGKYGFLREFSNIKKLDSVSSASRTKLLRLAKKTGLVETRAGINGGTWLHPKLGVVFARWLSVDFAVWCDLQIDCLIRGGADDWQQLRDCAAIGYRGMCDALQLSREAQGKAAARHHFMNEAKLINGVVFGHFKSVDRDALGPAELRMLALIEQRDSFLLGQGLDYQQRKEALTRYAQEQLISKLRGGAA